MKLLVMCLVFVAAISVAMGQNRYSIKPGSCPPPLPVQSCGYSCYVDSHCAGIGKCCPTNCGGTVCSMPVTTTQSGQSAKTGNCPLQPTGRWVCTSTCSSDSDCRGNLKCCKNRCGALACQKPEIEVLETNENPVEPVAPRFGYNY